MAAIELTKFGGEVPRITDRLLPDNHASEARNTKLLTGAIRSLRETEVLFNFGDTSIINAHRIQDPDDLSQFIWVGFDSRDVSFLKGPLINDSFLRYYRFGGGERPQFNTSARIKAGNPYYWLGVPTPVNAPALVITGGSGTVVTRSYVYTFVDEYGQEGPPSPPVTATGFENGSWDLSGMDTSVPDAANRPNFTKNIYRTVTGYQTVNFFFVQNIPLAQATYSDTVLDSTVASNNLLESEGWVEPPENLEGGIIMPNGFIAAWAGRDLHFSEPYRPHAWPVDYVLSVEFPIVGLGVWGQSIAVVTDGNPYTGTGVNPAGLTLTKSNTVEPGLSRHGVVSMPFGVYYPSQNGLVLIGPNGIDLATRPLFTEQEWARELDFDNFFAAKYGSQYLAFDTPDDGLMFDIQEETAAVVILDWFQNVDNIQSDPWTGAPYIMRGGVAEQWDSNTGLPGRWRWRSKLFDFKRPMNWGIAKFDWQCDAEFESLEELFAFLRWNEDRIVSPLNSVGHTPALGSSSKIINDPNFEENRHPVGGSALYVIAEEVNRLSKVTFRMLGECKEVLYEVIVDDEKPFRLPSGFKFEYYYFELEGYRDVYSLKIGETGKDLARV